MDMDRVDWDVDFEDDADESAFDDDLESLIELEAEWRVEGQLVD